MDEPRPLNYSTESPGRNRRLLLLLVLTLYPLLVVSMVHFLWAIEYLVNGTRPIPPHHGPDNWIEAFAYLFAAAGCFGSLVMLPLTVVACIAMFVEACLFANGSKTLRWLLPLGAWGVVYVIAAADPVRAFWFWID